MRKVNLLYVITKLELGGAQRQLLGLISGLDKNKFAVFLFSAKDGLLVSDALNISGLTVKRSRYLERAINPLKDIFALVEIYKFIRKNNIDIVHTHSSKAGILGRWAARRSGVKVILHTVHGWSFNDYQPFFSRHFFIWLERITAAFTDKLIVVSNYDKRKGLRERIGDEGKYMLIRYGINSNEFTCQNNTIRKELGLSDSDLLVGTVSCLKPQKSPQDFIKLCSLAGKTNPGIKFVLVGDGMLRKKIEGLIRKFNLGEKVILFGWRRDVPKILSSIDIFVLTSRWEGLPVSVLEAIAASRPVLATDTGGVSEIIEDGKTGFLAEPGDMESMGNKLSAILSSGCLRNNMAKEAFSRVARDFSLEQMIRNTQALYELTP